MEFDERGLEQLLKEAADDGLDIGLFTEEELTQGAILFAGVVATAREIGIPIPEAVTAQLSDSGERVEDFGGMIRRIADDTEFSGLVMPFYGIYSAKATAMELGTYDNPVVTVMRDTVLAEVLLDPEKDDDMFDKFTLLADTCLADYAPPFLAIISQVDVSRGQAEYNFFRHVQERQAQDAINSRAISSLTDRTANSLYDQYGPHDDQREFAIIAAAWSRELCEMMRAPVFAEQERSDACMKFLDSLDTDSAIRMGLGEDEVQFIVVEGASYLGANGYYTP